MRKILGLAVMVSVLGANAANAQNLVKNGDFDQVTNNAGVSQAGNDNYVINSAGNPSGYQYTGAYNLTSWTNTSFVGILFGAGLGDSYANPGLVGSTQLWSTYDTCGHGATGGYRACSWMLAGTNDGFPNSPLAASSPQGGNYFGADGAWNAGTLSQTITGLVVNQAYTLSFWSAGGVVLTGASNFGTASAGWNVTLGNGSAKDVNKSVKTGTYAANGSSSWVQTVVNFTASSSSEVLSFAPTGSGSPPMSLLDGVAIMAGTNVVPVPVPEPSDWALLAGGLVLVGARLRRRRAD